MSILHLISRTYMLVDLSGVKYTVSKVCGGVKDTQYISFFIENAYTCIHIHCTLKVHIHVQCTCIFKNWNNTHYKTYIYFT